MLYFAYGSNLNHQQMKNRCDGAKYFKSHILKGYKLCFSHKTQTSVYGHANIVKVKLRKFQEQFGKLLKLTKKN